MSNVLGRVEERCYIWFSRVLRWLMIPTATMHALHDRAVFPSHIAIWIAALLVIVFNEHRDWSTPRGHLPSYLRTYLGLSITASAMFVFLVVEYVSQPATHDHPAFTLLKFVTVIAGWLLAEIPFQLGLQNEGRAALSTSPPRLAEFALYITLPRRERDPIVGDLNEDFSKTILPKFGSLCGRGWYWYKAILCVWMYACHNAIEPLIRRVIEPLWRRVALPLLKWVVAPALLVNKHRLVEGIRTCLEKLR